MKGFKVTTPLTTNNGIDLSEAFFVPTTFHIDESQHRLIAGWSVFASEKAFDENKKELLLEDAASPGNHLSNQYVIENYNLLKDSPFADTHADVWQKLRWELIKEGLTKRGYEFAEV